MAVSGDVSAESRLQTMMRLWALSAPDGKHWIVHVTAVWKGNAQGGSKDISQLARSLGGRCQSFETVLKSESGCWGSVLSTP